MIVKNCTCCKAEFTTIEIVSIIAIDENGIWFNCECGSTLLLSVENREVTSLITGFHS